MTSNLEKVCKARAIEFFGNSESILGVADPGVDCLCVLDRVRSTETAIDLLDI